MKHSTRFHFYAMRLYALATLLHKCGFVAAHKRVEDIADDYYERGFECYTCGD